jgi:hypothetical protein
MAGSVPAKDLGNGSVRCGYCPAVMAPGQQHWCKGIGFYVKNDPEARKRKK